MGIMNRFSSGVTNKVGNKVLNIEEIKEKSILPTTKEEIAERRAKSRNNCEEEVTFIFRYECCTNSRIRFRCRY